MADVAGAEGSIIIFMVHYDENTGECLSTSSYSIPEASFTDYSDTNDFCMSTLPEGFIPNMYRVKLSDLGENNLPLYIVNRSTGEAYNHRAERAPSADISPENMNSSSNSSISADYMSSKGLTMGDVSTSDELITYQEGVDAQEGTSTASELTEDEITEQVAEYDKSVDDRMSGIGRGFNVLVNLVISPGPTGWPQDVVSGKYVRGIDNDHITPSTVLAVTGVNRGVIRSHIYWHSEVGRIVFETDERPTDALKIIGWLFETGDEWSANGVIEAWPGAGLVSKRLRQSIQQDDWSVTLAPHGETGDTRTIATRVSFANAELMCATPEWTGNTHVMIPRVYVDPTLAGGKRLCYTLTNLSDEEVTVTEVSIRMLYQGTVSGLVEDSTDTADILPYITEADIDLMTEGE